MVFQQNYNQDLPYIPYNSANKDYARFNRSLGRDTYYLTGMDEHGLKIETAAKENGCTPQEFVDKLAKNTSDLWKTLKITNDGFIRTS